MENQNSILPEYDKKIIIYGTTRLTDMYLLLFQNNKSFRIACFTADDDYVNGTEYKGYPLIKFSKIQDEYPPDAFDMIAVFGARFMRMRRDKFLDAKRKGYKLVNYIDDTAYISGGVAMGENNVILGQAHIGFFTSLGDNNIVRPNTYLGHHVKVSSHSIFAPGCSISSSCKIKDLCFIGIGSTIARGATVEDETLIGAGAVLVKNTEKYGTYVGNPARKVGEHEDGGIEII